jgi:hypothetical protein
MPKTRTSFKPGQSGNPRGTLPGTKRLVPSVRDSVNAVVADNLEAVMRAYQTTASSSKSVLQALDLKARVNREVGQSQEGGTSNITENMVSSSSHCSDAIYFDVEMDWETMLKALFRPSALARVRSRSPVVVDGQPVMMPVEMDVLGCIRGAFFQETRGSWNHTGQAQAMRGSRDDNKVVRSGLAEIEHRAARI